MMLANANWDARPLAKRKQFERRFDGLFNVTVRWCNGDALQVYLLHRQEQ
jgi:hypothetical protein